ncbi:ATP-binding protein [Pedobacter hartonius]|uniref:Histidine kinase-, DNA gyrase B-, and HSP90-like ATPase n=1 Tax=Pedobacter hartonius TaxID=425514 RepID=A0A1H4HFD6_9SPHI|nr:ATP-binding protein [Pedobacter hartonius]SEB20579.1 Histidine kinase-, DNA gyrase B-, and HSP90-like ATPase [Pedobacter hartonius]
MFKTEVVDPNVGNFIESIRDIGYSFEVAVADLIDNSITAGASQVSIHLTPVPQIRFAMLDNGTGMSESELREAMRLATKNPKDTRKKNDLGRFGLGLKTASFSQCRKLTVVSKKDSQISSKQWDLDYISEKNQWLLKTPEDILDLPLLAELKSQKSGTLVCWETIDRCEKSELTSVIDQVRKHLALVFHRFLEGADKLSIKISLNNNGIKPFNPFNLNHPATQQLSLERIKIHSSEVTVQPFILPHHSKLSQQEYEHYATEEGYIRSQGFYLYRENRILVYGTWWGLHKTVDAHKLVRIKIDIPNDMDHYWGIDIKKSTAKPADLVKTNLKRIISRVTEIGSKPFTGRGRKIEDKTLIQFWEIFPMNEDFRFAINEDHPLYADLEADLPEELLRKLQLYLKGLQAYLPIDAIQFKLQNSPHQLKQQTALTISDVEELTERLKSAGLPPNYIEELLKTEIFINRKELLRDGEK